MINPFFIVDEKDKKTIKYKTFGEEIEPLTALEGESLKLIINERVRFIFLIFLFILIGLILVRLFSLQILKGDNYLVMAERNEVRIERVAANRGIIYDRYLNPLVKNVPKSSLYLVPRQAPIDLEERGLLIEKINKIISEINDVPLDFDVTSEPILLKENLNQREKIIFEVEKEFLTGVALETKTGREYIQGNEFSHLLGYTGKISKEDVERGYSMIEEIGKAGIEQYYEDWLRGTSGKRRVELLVNQGQLINNFEDPKDGRNIILSIDLELQKFLAQSLGSWVKFSGGKSGSAVILSPDNGEVLALISYPFFDNNLFSRGISLAEYEKILSDPHKPLFFRAISGEYQPGSTIKPAIALAGLEEGVINQKTSFLSSGGVWAGRWFFADWKGGGHGQTNLKKSLAESVNTYYYILSGQNDFFHGLGPDKIYFYLRSFGLADKTNIDLASEAKGFIPTSKWKEETKNEVWYIGDSYNLGIGHGDLRVTPLQMAVMTAALANEGKMVKPIILQKILDLNGQEIIKESQSWQLPFRKENFKAIKDGMREAVLTGTAKALSHFPLELAGKTGTVEAGKDKPHSWFTCFASMDKPELVITVVVENGGEGSGPALNVAKETLDWWYQNRYLDK